MTLSLVSRRRLAGARPGDVSRAAVGPLTVAGSAGTEATAFGLDVRAGFPLRFLDGSRAAATGRPLRVLEAAGGRAALRWPEGAPLICSRRGPDGCVHFSIHAHREAGYLIWGERRGVYLLSRDGRQLRLAPERCQRPAWERFLAGQVLPFAALVAGLEVFHASAVVLDGRAVGFVGPSGAGKSSLAVELCLRGAGFLADDVLALEGREGELMAQPGTPVAGVDRTTADRLREAGMPLAGGPPDGAGAERLIGLQGAERPAALAALFFLDRTAAGGAEVRFEPLTDARALLASTFNFVLETPQRMRGLLDVCALAAQGRVERIVIGPSGDPGTVAEAVISRLGGTA